MTEQEWLTDIDPQSMLAFFRGKGSERKIRLLHCACCRRVWSALEPRSRYAVEVVEQFADGSVEIQLLQSAAAAAEQAWREDEIGFPAPAATAALWRQEQNYSGTANDVEPLEMAVSVVQQLAFEGNWVLSDGSRSNDSEAAGRDESRVQATMVRDLFGNPFDPVTLNPCWLTHTVVALAQTTYGDNTLDLLPVLADALEEAGCTHQEILRHCRNGGPHVRGCWVVDLLLAKE